MNFFKRLWEDFKASRRDERRVAPKQARGRVYEKKAAPQGPGANVMKRGIAELEMKITRADGTVEYRTTPAFVEKR